MATNASSHSLRWNPEDGPWREVDWRYALGMFTTALFLLGAATLFHLLLPNRRLWGNIAALAITFLWRFGAHKVGFFPWTFRIRERRLSFSPPQAVIEGFAIFVFLLVVLIFPRLTVSSTELILAAIGGLAIGIYSGWYSPPTPPASS